MITLPPGISRESLAQFLNEERNRETLLQSLVGRFEQRYGSLETLEARLTRGEGDEHPDWEDSIEWRNAAEALQGRGVHAKYLTFVSSPPFPVREGGRGVRSTARYG